MFYFKGQKREIRRPIIKVFSKLNWASFSNDNFILTSKLKGSELSIIRLHANTTIKYPETFTYQDFKWDSKGTMCVGVHYSLLKCVSMQSEIKNIDGLYYEFVTMQVEQIKSFTTKRDYEVFKSVSADFNRIDGFLLEEQVINSVLINNQIPSDMKSIKNLSESVFSNMDLLIEKSSIMNNKKLAS